MGVLSAERPNRQTPADRWYGTQRLARKSWIEPACSLISSNRALNRTEVSDCPAAPCDSTITLRRTDEDPIEGCSQQPLIQAAVAQSKLVNEEFIRIEATRNAIERSNLSQQLADQLRLRCTQSGVTVAEQLAGKMAEIAQMQEELKSCKAERDILESSVEELERQLEDERNQSEATIQELKKAGVSRSGACNDTSSTICDKNTSKEPVVESRHSSTCSNSAQDIHKLKP